MDDPISALDANVKKKIFKEVFQGMLRNKTRVLVTHAVDFLHLADRIVIMQGGKIQAQGTMTELENNPHLKQVMETHRKNQVKTQKETSTDSVIENPSLRLENESLLKSSDTDLSTSRFKLNRSDDVSLTISNLIPDPKRVTAKEIEVIEEEDEDRMKFIEPDADLPESPLDIEIEEEGDGEEIDAKTVASEVDRKFRQLGLHGMVDTQIAKIIEDESREAVIVKPESYKKLYTLTGGFPIFFIINLSVIFAVFFSLATNYLISKWAYSDPQVQSDKRIFYTVTILGLSILQSLGVFGRVYLLVLAT